ncbi:MAG: hypothetical protein IPP90_20865 [Gemmatimonadaceae bacterium]|nr:hypothetical protein [Gemmatimonadaceae bacterium]
MPVHETPPPPERTTVVDASGTERPWSVHVVAHTHWDREWYHSAERFQARLVALIDALLDGQPDSAAPFLLDGQTIVLADYLAVKPERSGDVARALMSGALETGPWYVLADNLIPSAEAVIRNLEAGRRWLARLNATAPRVAYCPDTFGHPSALPAIAQGFGFVTAIVWRGFGGRSHPAVDTAWWVGPDSSRVLLYHLPPDGYEFGSALPTAPDAVAERWRHVASTMRPRNQTGVSLLLTGADHHARSPHLSQAIAQLQGAAERDGARVERNGLARASDELVQAAIRYEEHGGVLPVVRGELRDSYGYTWTLQGTLATRAHRKRRNAQLERALVRDVEPWTALAWLHAPVTAHFVSADGSLTLAQLPALVAHTWEMLLRTHPHDTLCGCSIDAVAAAVATRQRAVADAALELRDAALACALAHDRVAARDGPVAVSPLTVVRNRGARARGGMAELRVTETLGDVSVGPGSAGAPPVVIPDGHRRPLLGNCTVQPLREHVTHARRESPQHYPDTDLVRVHRLVAWMPVVPAFGVRVIGPTDDALPVTPAPVVVRETPDGVELDNGRLRIMASSQGVSIASGARRLDDVLGLETTVDLGDSYTPSLRGSPELLRLHTVRLGAQGPLRASVLLHWLWRHGREQVRVSTEIILDAGASHVRCDVRGWNARRNHRLQLVWRTDVPVPRVTADAAFGPVVRTSTAAVPDALPFEMPASTMPLHRWLSVHDDDRGVTLISDGLCEGDPGGHRLAVTLVRAIGELSRAELPERPGHAGWPSAIPAAQCQGRFAARVGLLLHGPWTDATLDDVEETAETVLLPLVGESWRDLAGDSRVLAGPTLAGDGLVASAVCLSTSGESLILRATNAASRAGCGVWTLPGNAAWRFRRCRMDGTPMGDWTASRGAIPFDARSREVVTLEVQRDY